MKREKILIVDNNQKFIASLSKTLSIFKPKGKELKILTATSEQSAIVLLQDNLDIKVILLAYVMEHEDSGRRIFDFVRKDLKNDIMQIIYLTEGVPNANQQKIVERDSPNDFINKIFEDKNRIQTSIAIGLDNYNKLTGLTAETNIALQKIKNFESAARREIEEKMGKGKVISKVFDKVEKYALSNIPILIEGETGTGKELIARYISTISSTKMTIQNCSALNPELAYSELFGHKKGAFTGADNDTIGIVKATEGGILFLDEINSLSIKVQIQLLRVIEQGTFIRMGDTSETKVNVRIIAAGNESFKDLIAKGLFRKDLYIRFTKKIYLPTLKERIEDMDYFIDHFLLKESKNQGKKVFISNEARKLLSDFHWEGNVRELKNIIINLVIEVDLIDKQSNQYVITPKLVKECLQDNGDLSNGLPNEETRKNNLPDNVFAWEKILAITRKEAIIRALIETHGNNEKAIALLGISRITYYRWKKEL
ncbi:MAG: sigma 54-interacting transcriptional regulator, partial [Bacteroidales bacterium]|nr:sigma 54-interacting transcriptional regulator [Bacteroidales bacterium]